MGRTDITSPEQNENLLPGLHFLCRLFWGPDSHQCLEMMAGRFTNVFNPLKAFLPARATAACDAFAAFLAARQDADTLCRDLEIIYARLFLSGRGTAGAPLYQSCYGFDDIPLMGPPALRMKERLGSAGLSIAGQGNELPDHLAVELEFLCFLLLKAREDEAPEMEALAVAFAQNELCVWLPLFSERLARIPDAEPYDHAAVLTRELAFFIAGEQ